MTLPPDAVRRGEEFTDEQIIADLNWIIQKDLLRVIEIFMVPAIFIRWSLDSDRWEFDFVIDDSNKERIGERLVLSELHMVVFAPAGQVNRVLRTGRIMPPVVVAEARPRSVRVALPEEIRESLFALAQRPDDIEYGGAIDFELVGDRAEVERIVTFLGEEGKVAGELFKRWSPDFEVTFHTHPNRPTAQPSKADIIFLLRNPQKAMIIVAENDLAVFEKTRPVLISSDELDDLALKADVSTTFGRQQKILASRIRVEKFLLEALGIKVERIFRHQAGAVPLNLEVVRDQMGKRRRIQQ